MREIKFRIRLKSNYKEEYCTLYNSVFDQNIGIAFYPIHKEEWDILSVDEYTGLKDKNGKEIYEGDILKYYDLLFPVVFEYGCFYGDGESDNLEFDSCDYDKVEVIGNIHENTLDKKL